MLFLRSIIRFRSSMQRPDAEGERAMGEMSFLEHLEELRRTLIRMCIAVMVGMLACFAFTPSMLELLRRPVEQVWSNHEKSHLPGGVDVSEWLAAKDLEQVRRSLEPSARALLESKFAPQVLTMAEALPLLRAAAVLPETEQKAWLEQATPPGAVQQLALQLHEAGADLSDAHGRAEPQLMGAFQPGEAFMLSLQLAFFGGLIVAGPLVLYFALQFIIPGLLAHEKRLICRSLWWGLGLFAFGCVFSYYAVLPRVLSFFFEYSWDLGIANDWRIGYYLSFAAKLIFVFGVIFELPVVMVPLIKLGILTYERMKRIRAYALVGSFAVALLLAPAPDPGTMFIMAVPLYVLYELCILIAWREAKRRDTMQDVYPEAR